MRASPWPLLPCRVDQTSLLLNGTVIGGLQSPPSGWLGAVVQGAVYAAAVQASAEKSLSLAERQLAVSYAAHDALAWAFQGTRLYRTVDAAFATAAVRIGLNGSTTAGAKQARAIGEKAAVRVAAARAGDGLARYVAYSYGPPLPGVYQQTPGGAPLPDTPQAAHVRSFGGVGSLSKFRSAPPPATTSHEYEKSVLYVKEQGERNSTVRAKFDTETAYYWRESSFT